jgi:PKD domain
MKPANRRWLVALALGLLSFVLFVPGAAGVIVVTVGPNVNVSAAAGNQAEASIAVDPTNTQRLFEVSNPGSTAAVSTNGGTSWTRFSIGGSGGLPTSCCDNVAVFDQFGNLFLVYINGATNQIVLALSTNGGQPGSFTLLQTIDTGNIDQPTVAVGAGTVWVTWNKNSTIMARGAQVTGLGTVGAFTAAQSAPGSNPDGQFGDIAIGPAGQVTVCYQSNSQIFANTDGDGLGAGGFGARVTVSSTNVAKFDFLPAQSGRSVDAECGLAYDSSGGPNNGRLYMVYTDEQPDESNDMDILLRSSNNNGANWSAPLRVNDDAGTNSQFLPHLAVDQSTGFLAVTWHDARNDSGSGPGDTDGVANDDAQFWGTFSTDGGATVRPNFQISAGTSNDNDAASGVDYGDYSWSSFVNGLLYPAWADNSNSTGDNPNGTLHQFDIYTARIHIFDDKPPVVTVADASGNEGAAIPITGTATDPDGDPLTTNWTVTPGGGVDPGAICTIAAPASLSTTVSCTDDGSYTLTLTASDGINPPVSATGTLTVANVPAAVSISSPTNGQLFQLGDTVNVTAPFSDPGTNDTHTCSIDWGDTTVTAGVVTEVAGAGTCTGSHAYSSNGPKTITVFVTDDDGGTGLASVTIDINAPPNCSTVTPDQTSLWPPNHTLRLATLSGATDPDGDPVTLTVTAVTQDEPLNGQGDGDTSPDAVLAPQSDQVYLRAERAGPGDGRVYRISFMGSDGRGGFCTGGVHVDVPHDRSGRPAVDSGLVVNSLG